MSNPVDVIKEQSEYLMSIYGFNYDEAKDYVIGLMERRQDNKC